MAPNSTSTLMSYAKVLANGAGAKPAATVIYAPEASFETTNIETASISANKKKSASEVSREFRNCLCLSRSVLPAPPNGEKTELCHYKLQRKWCPHEGHCQWAHKESELRWTEDERKHATKEGFKTRICRNPRCQLGKKCFNRHSTKFHLQELKNLELGPRR